MMQTLTKKEGYIVEGNLRIPFQILRTSRKTAAIQVKPDGLVVVRIPKRMPWKWGEEFLEQERRWATARYREMTENYKAPRAYTEEETRRGREAAARVIAGRAKEYARQLGVDYGRITIREQKTRWGSCSVRGNLNFNWKLVLMPERILDYVVVHELAHRREMNHSPRFWSLVEAVLPDYRERRRWLKEHGGEY